MNHLTTSMLSTQFLENGKMMKRVMVFCVYWHWLTCGMRIGDLVVYAGRKRKTKRRKRNQRRRIGVETCQKRPGQCNPELSYVAVANNMQSQVISYPFALIQFIYDVPFSHSHLNSCYKLGYIKGSLKSVCGVKYYVCDHKS